jgi:hypothetical protein
MKKRLTSPLRNLGMLLALSLATACQFGDSPEAEEIPVSMERSGDSLRISWSGDKVHRVSVLRCNEAPTQGVCACNGALVWALGAGESEKYDQVALEQPFIASPLEYGVAPASDRRAYAARPLEQGKQYLLEVSRVGPCDKDPKDCQMVTAVGCQAFTW